MDKQKDEKIKEIAKMHEIEINLDEINEIEKYITQVETNIFSALDDIKTENPIIKLTAFELHEKILNKEIKVEEAVNAYMDSIQELNSVLGAYITVCKEQALEQAREIQKKIDNNRPVGKLAGVPIAIKDNICTKKIKTTCASKMLENFVSPYNATVIELLLKEDAIIIGKTNMDEFAMGGSTENSAFMLTRNPHNLMRVPGGSSGGSAVAVAANLASCSLGSDTGGSIREPASFCGIVGLKPTYGLVSRYGLVAFASSLDQIGPMTKDVRDAAYLLNIIAKHDEMDSTSRKVEEKDYLSCLKNSVKGLKIGVPKEFLGEGINDEVKKNILESVEKLNSLGAETEECSLKFTDYGVATYYILACAEASSNLGRFDGVRYGYRSKNFTNVSEMIKNSRSEAFGEEVKRRIMLGTYVLSAGYYDAYYKKALKIRDMVVNEFNKLFEKYDALVMPTVPTTAFRIGEKSDNPLQMYLSDICTVMVNIAGLPGISIPSGKDSNNLPIGLQIVGKKFSEDKLLQIAYTFEKNK